MNTTWFDVRPDVGATRLANGSAWPGKGIEVFPHAVRRSKAGVIPRVAGANAGKKRTDCGVQSYPLWTGVLLIALGFFAIIELTQFTRDPYPWLFPVLEVQPKVITVSPPLETFSAYRGRFVPGSLPDHREQASR